jgi:methylglyoxal synthase
LKASLIFSPACFRLPLAWQAALIAHDHCDYATIALVQNHKEEYLSSSWQ